MLSHQRLAQADDRQPRFGLAFLLLQDRSLPPLPSLPPRRRRRPLLETHRIVVRAVQDVAEGLRLRYHGGADGGGEEDGSRRRGGGRGGGGREGLAEGVGYGGGAVVGEQGRRREEEVLGGDRPAERVEIQDGEEGDQGGAAAAALVRAEPREVQFGGVGVTIAGFFF
ncbi:hypothetical protein AXF42_Ash014301 [Apostasia shenzhenica]|uniref:Uncharacterized protein n=1 Tax=Apostasia shenzhenica TaxID=1088818 RepID=A0A2I0B0T0_9ASPA|nr:hypothetical protein AXF42_Ash014301 [Apostasia shenzhenica]